MTEPFPSRAYQELCIEKRDEDGEGGGMNEQAEKLAEEIRWLICPVCEFYNVDYERCDSSMGLCDGVIVAADLVISRIGKAFRDGELDEVLGVVGRGEMNVTDLALHIGWRRNLEVEGNVVNVIALSPSGIPVERKEEE